MPFALRYQIEEPSGGTVDYDFAHLDGGSYAGPQISLGWEVGNAATQTYWCRWSDLDAFMFAVIGQNDVDTEAGGRGRWLRHLPHKFPFSSLSNLYASRITSVVGIPGPNPDFDPTDTEDAVNFSDYPQIDADGKIQFLYAGVTVQYEPSPWPMLTDAQIVQNQPPSGGKIDGVAAPSQEFEEWQRFVTVRKVPRLEWFQVQAGTLFWVDTPVKAGDSRDPLPHNFINLREETIDYIVTVYRLPSPIKSPQDYIGYINAYSEFLKGHPQVPTDGFDHSTMLLTGIQEHIYPVAFTSVQYYQYDLMFSFKVNGWNKTRRIRPSDTPPTFNFNSFTIDGGTPSSTNVVYRPADVRRLFLPGA
jgi:hypothetical protein